MTPPLRRVCLVEGGGSSNPLQQKYEEYRSALKNNAGDFQTWTYLLGTVERLVSSPFSQSWQQSHPPFCAGLHGQDHRSV